MARRFGQCLAAGFSVVCLLLAAPQPVSATIVFDDHFDGNSGGMPAGWYLSFGTGTVVESGTVVSLLYSKVVIASDAVLDPSAGAVSINLQIAEVTGTAMAGGGFASGSSHFGVLIGVTDGEVSVISQDEEGGEQNYVAGYLSGYTGAPIGVTLELGPTTFRVSTDSPPFDSGDILYTAVFPTFTRDDLGGAAQLVLVNDVEPGETGSSNLDRITVDAEGGTQVESMTFGRIKAVFRR